MNIGPAGLKLVKNYEGYAKELSDGSGRCTAYQEQINGKLDRPTLGYGCTRGITMGMVWTRAEAEAALLVELEQHAKRVDRLVTVELNANERDALISFDYNCGGLTSEQGATGVLKAINAGDRAKTVSEMLRWVKFGGKESKGLTARRAAEVALFLKPMAAVASDYMPQEPEQARRKLSTTEKMVAGAAGATGVIQGGRAVVDQAKEAKGVLVDARGLVPITTLAAPHVLIAGGLVAAALLAVVLIRRAT